jgi:bifunctional DNA primase/polymerase-like protein
VTSSMWEAALAAIGRGWPVFVLGRTKRPVANCPACPTVEDDPGHDRQACPCLTCHGFYAATRDPQRIAAMLAAVPAGLLAIRTGAPSGLVVVDIDPDHGGAIDRGLMTPTHTVVTGSGGWHLYYTHPGRHVPSRRMPDRAGVDIKADGGYVVVPPSVHPRTRRRYVPVGAWPVTEMRPRLAAAVRATSAPSPTPRVTATRPTPRPESSGGGRISSPPTLLAALLHRVTTAPAGRRRTTLYGAAHGVARLVAAGVLDTATAVAELAAAGQAAGQNDRDIRAAIAGAFRDEAVPLHRADLPGEA